MIHEERRAVPHRKRIVLEPVAEDDDTLVATQRQVDQEVTMPEEVVVDLGVLGSIGLGSAHQPLLLDVEVIILIGVGHLAEDGTLETFLTATQRAGESKAYRPAWMDSGI